MGDGCIHRLIYASLVKEIYAVNDKEQGYIKDVVCVYIYIYGSSGTSKGLLDR